MINSTPADISRRAFDGIVDLKASQSINALNDAAHEQFAGLGLPSFALARFFDPCRRANTKVFAGQFHAEWSCRYIAKGYAKSSTIAAEMLRTNVPYTWNQAVAKRGLAPEQAKIWNEAADYGLTDGLFTPVRWLDGSYAAVVLGGDRPALDDPLLLISAEILSTYYSSEVRRLMFPVRDVPVLSARQRECLAWVRQGKSSSVISAILGISVLTVDEHVAEACRRLGVRTRVQAAVEAALMGLID